METGSLPIVVSLFALFISILSYLNARKATSISFQKYQEEKSERLSKRFAISVYDRFGYEAAYLSKGPPHRWGVMLSVANRSEEPVYIYGLQIELRFRQPFSSLDRRILCDLFGSAFDIRKSFVYKFSLHSESSTMVGSLGVAWSSGIHSSMNAAKLIDWERESPIGVFAEHPHRGPAPGEKELWVLVGIIPEEVSEQLKSQGFRFVSIALRFFSDHGDQYVEAPMQVTNPFYSDFLDRIERALGSPWE